MNFVQSYQRKNPCYVRAKARPVTGICLYVMAIYPSEERQKVQEWSYEWSSPCPHAIVQTDRSTQLLPWEYESSYEGTFAGSQIKLLLFEYREEDRDGRRFAEVCSQAARLCAILCKKYRMDPGESVTCHKEVCRWFFRHGMDIRRFRENTKRFWKDTVFHHPMPFQVRITVPRAAIRSGPSKTSPIIFLRPKGTVYTIEKKVGVWGKIVGHRQYVALSCTEKLKRENKRE